MVAAAGVDRNGNHSAISVVDPDATLAAPSDNIVQTDTRYDPSRTGYSIGTGTSISTAIIAGAAALVRARFPKLSAVEVIHRLTATADDKGPPGRDNQYGYGIVNLVKALTADVPPLTPSASRPAGRSTRAGRRRATNRHHRPHRGDRPRSGVRSAGPDPPPNPVNSD